MTEMQTPTPGPWSYDGPRDNIHVRQAADPNMRVCFMTSDGPTRENARLIAAAPDMLKALRAISNTNQHMRDGIDCTPDLMRKMARAAIAKAEGASTDKNE